jgi:uncharacterized RDD family membrane protein YckC
MAEETTPSESTAEAAQRNGRPTTLSERLLGGGARSARRVVGVSGLDRMIESALERSVDAALDSDMVDRIWERLLDSDETQKLIERIAEAPELRAAVAAQSRGVLEDLAQQAREVARRIDGAVERPLRWVLRRGRRTESSPQAGAATRLMALALDAGIINAVFLIVSGLFALAASVVFPNEAVVVAVGATTWAIGAGLYFLIFWATSGQTPGMRLMGIRLLTPGSPEIGAWRAIERLVGVGLCALTLGIGLLPILFTKRRRGLQDWTSGLEVVYAGAGEPEPVSDPR